MAIAATMIRRPPITPPTMGPTSLALLPPVDPWAPAVVGSETDVEMDNGADVDVVTDDGAGVDVMMDDGAGVDAVMDSEAGVVVLTGLRRVEVDVELISDVDRGTVPPEEPTAKS